VDAFDTVASVEGPINPEQLAPPTYRNLRRHGRTAEQAEALVLAREREAARSALTHMEFGTIPSETAFHKICALDSRVEVEVGFTYIMGALRS